MADLFALLIQAGARIEYLEQEGFLPIRITGQAYAGGNKNAEKIPGEAARENVAEPLHVKLDISKSTQFLSAMLLIAPMVKQGLRIEITSEKTDGSYIRITRKMMEDWGVKTGYDGRTYTVAADAAYHKADYVVEPDMSAACYFYAAAAVTGGTALVRNIHPDNTQGDRKFLSVLEQLGCTVTDEAEGIRVTGPAHGSIQGIEVDMNDFSDQTMTLAAIAPYASSPTHISHIGHIRLQESDRIHAIVTELTRAGIRCDEEADAITIYPGRPHAALIETYDDHRMAMAFSLLGLRTDGIIIHNPSCCRKTFEDYFEILDALSRQDGSQSL